MTYLALMAILDVVSKQIFFTLMHKDVRISVRDFSASNFYGKGVYSSLSIFGYRTGHGIFIFGNV